MSGYGAIDLIARRQYGLISSGQLLAAGVPEHAIERMLANGRLRLARRGVYRLCGCLPSWRASALAVYSAFRRSQSGN